MMSSNQVANDEHFSQYEPIGYERPSATYTRSKVSWPSNDPFKVIPSQILMHILNPRCRLPIVLYFSITTFQSRIDLAPFGHRQTDITVVFSSIGQLKGNGLL